MNDTVEIKRNYYYDGIIFEELCFTDGILYREGLPSVFEYNRYGYVDRVELYNKSGILHKIDGPAIICYNSNGDIEELHWFFNDVCYTEIVKDWFYINGFNNYLDVNSEDYNRMWFEIL